SEVESQSPSHRGTHSNKLFIVGFVVMLMMSLNPLRIGELIPTNVLVELARTPAIPSQSPSHRGTHSNKGFPPNSFGGIVQVVSIPFASGNSFQQKHPVLSYLLPDFVSIPFASGNSFQPVVALFFVMMFTAGCLNPLRI